MMKITTILNTKISECGPVQNIDAAFLRVNLPLRINAHMCEGDIIEIQGRECAQDEWETLHIFSFNDGTDVDVMPQMRAVRIKQNKSNAYAFVRAHSVYLVETDLSEHEAPEGDF